MRLLFLHGWGLDATLWDEVRGLLSPIESHAWDRGYFGQACDVRVAGPLIGVGHSLGALLLAADPPIGCVGLVAINGFDRFAGEGRVPIRTLDRMRSRFRERPGDVLDAFRARCGAPPHTGPIREGALACDLDRLATGDAQGGLRPLLALHGGADPILPIAMRRAMFGGAAQAEQADAGHLLPLTHPRWCADQIRGLLA